jgi:hypothetical protein
VSVLSPPRVQLSHNCLPPVAPVMFSAFLRNDLCQHGATENDRRELPYQACRLAQVGVPGRECLAPRAAHTPHHTHHPRVLPVSMSHTPCIITRSWRTPCSAGSSTRWCTPLHSCLGCTCPLGHLPHQSLRSPSTWAFVHVYNIQSLPVGDACTYKYTPCTRCCTSTTTPTRQDVHGHPGVPGATLTHTL